VGNDGGAGKCGVDGELGNAKNWKSRNGERLGNKDRAAAENPGAVERPAELTQVDDAGEFSALNTVRDVGGSEMPADSIGGTTPGTTYATLTAPGNS
jgi:hypothetical protein